MPVEGDGIRSDQSDSLLDVLRSLAGMYRCVTLWTMLPIHTYILAFYIFVIHTVHAFSQENEAVVAEALRRQAEVSGGWEIVEPIGLVVLFFVYVCMYACMYVCMYVCNMC